MLAFLLATAFVIIQLRSLFAAVIMTGIFSLLSAGIFFLMDAADVAFTEAAVGAGVSTVLMLATLALTVRQQKRGGTQWRVGPLLLVAATGALMVWGTLDMPRFGDPEAPIHRHVAPRYLEESPKEIGVPNVVTSVLASYRGYDTFGETTVIFTAAIGVFLLLGTARRKKEDDVKTEIIPVPRMPEASADRLPRLKGYPVLRYNVILRVSTKPLIPFILLFALYVQFHGDYGPGGGFQAGVIFAAAIVLYALVFGFYEAFRIFHRRLLAILTASGVLLYGMVGVISMLLGGNFLDYSVLAHDPVHGQHYGILLIELGVGLSVAAVMLSLYFFFAGRRLM